MTKQVGIEPLIFTYLDTETPPLNLLIRHLYEYDGSGRIKLTHISDYTNETLDYLNTILDHYIRLIYDKSPRFGTPYKYRSPLNPEDFFEIYKNSLPEGKDLKSKIRYYSNKTDSNMEIFKKLYFRLQNIINPPQIQNA